MGLQRVYKPLSTNPIHRCERNLKSCSSHRDVHDNLMKSCHAAKPATVFFKFLYIVFSVCGAHDEQVIACCLGFPFRIPTRRCEIATSVMHLAIAPTFAVSSSSLDT